MIDSLSAFNRLSPGFVGLCVQKKEPSMQTVSLLNPCSIAKALDKKKYSQINAARMKSRMILVIIMPKKIE